MRLTEFEFYYNTPFTDFQNFIHFSSNQERDEFFDTHYQSLKYTQPKRWDFVKDRLILNSTLTTQQTYGLNYCRFRNDYDNNRWYYAYVMQSEYVNDHVTQLQLVLDPVTTFMQGDFTKNIGRVEVKRQTVTNALFQKYKDYLMTNGDVLAFPKRYTHQAIESWKEFFVIFTSSVSLTNDFGTEENPTLKTSTGQTYDRIVSPVDLYCVSSQSDFSNLMKVLSDYPWIAQNIGNVAIVPAEAVDESDLSMITDAKNDKINNAGIYRFKNNGKTASFELKSLRFEKSQLNTLFGFDANIPEWALREEYSNIELDSWDGQTLSLAPNFLPTSGLTMMCQCMFGYHNEMRIFPDQYKDGGSNDVTGLYRGTYANNAIIFSVFDDIPILIDNYKLSKAQTAHQRALTNDRQISNRIQDVFDNSKSLKDRFFNAVSLTTGLIGGVARNATNQFTSEWEYYRDQQAKFADLAISAPSVGQQNNSQSFNIAKNIFGVTVKFSSIGKANMRQVLRYYNTFGFSFGGQMVELEKPDSLPMMNYYQFGGNWNLRDVPSQFMQQLKIQLENGIKLWKNDGSDNPFIKDTVNNY